MIKHLSIRVAWHDNKWNGTICNHPAQNTFCIHLPRIYEEKIDVLEEQHAGKSWSKLDSDLLPPCKAEGGGFMSSIKYVRQFNHPYNQPNRKNIPHLALRPTAIDVPPYSTFAVPFWWMLNKNQSEIRDQYPEIPEDEKPPFPSSWVYSNKTQEALLKRFFGPIKENYSLTIFYSKGANPVDDESRRLIVGIGLITKKSPILNYNTTADYTYPLWDRLITHGIRPDNSNSEGFLIPYHEYLELPDDFELRTKERRKSKFDLIDEIKLTLQETASRQEIIDEFAYGTAWVNNSTLLTVLSKLKTIVERIKEHGIVKGQWDNSLIWIDQQIGKVKENMGPFPSFANALLALGFQYGNTLEEDIRKNSIIGSKDNPWRAWEDILIGKIKIDKAPYNGDLPHLKDVWKNESKERKSLLILLSRMELSDKQIKNWFDPMERNKLGYSVSDSDIIGNPYILPEEDTGDQNHYAIAVETVDNGFFSDKAIQGDFIPDKPQLVESPLDPRRIRAILINILKQAASNGDTLLSIDELTVALNELNLQRATKVPLNYISANIEFIKEKTNFLSTEKIPALQLRKYFDIEDSLRKILIARAKKDLAPIEEDWQSLVKKTIKENGIDFDNKNPRHAAALKDQVASLQQIAGRKLSVLHGPAGTGKTTVMGALFGSAKMLSEGILLLAPTGKARVKLGKMAGADAFTIAQFLNKQGRFDWIRMRPKFTGKDKYKAEQNVIIDECSMLTEDDIYALLQALDLGHVKRIILVGDPYQLPPIGAGRPFADLCGYLESLSQDHDDFAAYFSLARLKEVVRTVKGQDSDTLTLASWYSGAKPSKNADAIFSKLGDNSKLNDLKVVCWNDEDSLVQKLNEELVKELDLKDEKDYATLNSFLGVNGGRIDTKKIEAFQLLSPVKGPFWGSFNLNRKFQQQFRAGFRNGVSIGEYQIGLLDKVIQTTNEWKEAFPGGERYQLSNGQLGIVQSINKGFANVVFAGIEERVSFGYKSQGQSENDNANLELAYAITIHKSQGSDFDYVFLIVPKSGRIISRELIYTALTRAKKKLILFVEGDDPHWIINLSKPQYSATAKRNTHLFSFSVRDTKSSIPFAEGLIHKTRKEGLIVRSKSEVIVANMLIDKGMEFEYEREFIGAGGAKRIPDFTFVDASGEIIILEHLGMMSLPSYKSDWEKKLEFYKSNGFKINENLFTTTESNTGAIDSIAIEKTLEAVRKLI